MTYFIQTIKSEKMRLATVHDYCQQNGISAKIAEDNIRKGKIEVLELPVFAEYQGTRFEIGTERFVKSPEFVLPDATMDDTTYARHMASQVTDSPKIRQDIEKLLLADEETQSRLKASLANEYAKKSSAERQEWEASNARLRKLMLQEAMDLHRNLEALAAEL